jgi:sarcosine oxidase delta subunit
VSPPTFRARRLLQRTRLSDALAFDEFITAVVLLSWLVYGFKVPQSSTRGVARSLRFFVERVMRGNVVEMHTAHDILLQFASARTAEGATPIAAKDALFVYRYFTRDNPEGMSLEQWLELVQWLLAISAETNKYGILLFYTHQGPIKVGLRHSPFLIQIPAVDSLDWSDSTRERRTGRDEMTNTNP